MPTQVVLSSTNGQQVVVTNAGIITSIIGAVGDGVTDNTTVLQNAINAANTAGGGLLYLGPGTFVTQTLQWYSNIYLMGSGANATILQLKTGTNADLIWGGNTNQALISPWSANGSGNTGGLSNFGFMFLTLDGNKANQSGTSHCVEIYGLNWRFLMCDIRNALSNNVVLDWNGGNTPAGQDGMEGSMIDCKLRGAGQVNLLLAGPHDSKIVNCTFSNSGWHSVYNGPNAIATQYTNCHGWGPGLGGSFVSLLGDAEQLHFSNCEWEGSDTVQVAMMAKRWTYDGGSIFGALANASSGLQIGQASGNTPYKYSNFQTVPGATSGGTTTTTTPSSYRFSTSFYQCSGTNGTLWFASDGGGKIDAAVDVTSGGTVFTGTISANSRVDYISDISGSANHPESYFPGLVFDSQQPNASAQTIASNGTIQPSGVETVIVTTAGNVTGVIIAVGLGTGCQILNVCNKSANTLTMDVSGTSHVADGTSDVIQANSVASYRWVVGPNLWYRVK